METILHILFWASLGILLYTYVIYGLLIAILAAIRSRKRLKSAQIAEEFPEVAIVIPAFNEVGVLENKIKNTLSLDYPAEKMKVLVITDGSTDGSETIAASFSDVTVLHQHERKGKTAAIQRAMDYVHAPVTVFTDANSLLNPEALRELVACYADHATGGVAGEKKILSNAAADAVTKGESLYWKYESALKRWDAEVYSVMGAAGELFSIRTALFEKMPEDTLLDDLMLSMRVCEKGYRIAYAPRAMAMEKASASLKDEWQRKVRIAAGGFQAMARLHVLTYIYRFPITAFQFLSHRASRWAACPPALLFLFLSAALLAMWKEDEWMRYALIAQVIFYGLAVIGRQLSAMKKAHLLFYIPFYFTWMHAAALTGWIYYMTGRQNILWHKAGRVN